MTERPARVLIVGRQGAVREAVENALWREGLVVRSDTTGSGIAHSVRTFEPDIAIIGHDLPDGPDGCTIVAELRTRGSLPAVLLGSGDSLTERLAGFGAGADDCLSQPFHIEELLARVAALLRRNGRFPAGTCPSKDPVVDETASTVTTDSTASSQPRRGAESAGERVRRSCR